MARHYLKRPAGPMFRPDLALPPDARGEFARLMSEVASRAGTGAPTAGALRVLQVLTALAAAAAGDGPVQAAADLDEGQAAALRDCIEAARRRALADGDTSAAVLQKLRDEWSRFAGLQSGVLEPLPAGRSW